jgi:hypothetical protein
MTDNSTTRKLFSDHAVLGAINVLFAEVEAAVAALDRIANASDLQWAKDYAAGAAANIRASMAEAGVDL